MEEHFNLDELFQIAIKLEQNGAVFYREAMNCAVEPVQRDLLAELAMAAEGYAAALSDIREEIGQDSRRDSVYEGRDSSADYLWAWAGHVVFNADADPFNLVAADACLGEILEVAIRRKKESIVFYEGLLRGCEKPEHRQRVERFLTGEMLHLANLSEQSLRVRELMSSNSG